MHARQLWEPVFSATRGRPEATGCGPSYAAGARYLRLSDFANSDFANSDLANSDSAHSDLANAAKQ
jgi:hypothetical protein